MGYIILSCHDSLVSFHPDRSYRMDSSQSYQYAAYFTWKYDRSFCSTYHWLFAQIPIRRMLGTSNIYITAILRLFAIPLLILYLSRLCHVEPTIANINVILAAMPVASYGTLFCIQYEKGETIMAQGTFITTLLSVLTIPLLTLFL